MSSEKLSTAWTEAVEGGLVKRVKKAPILWKCRDDADMGDDEKAKITEIREALNRRYETKFTDAMVTKKWLELALLFDCKYIINGCSMADRGQVKKKGGVVDDLSERWVHFQNLSYLVGSKTGKAYVKPVKKEVKQELE